jgi:hypothetical protein
MPVDQRKPVGVHVHGVVTCPFGKGESQTPGVAAHSLGFTLD